MEDSEVMVGLQASVINQETEASGEQGGDFGTQILAHFGLKFSRFTLGTNFGSFWAQKAHFGHKRLTLGTNGLTLGTNGTTLSIN